MGYAGIESRLQQEICLWIGLLLIETKIELWKRNEKFRKGTQNNDQASM